MCLNASESFHGVPVTFEKLEYTVPLKKKETLTILKGIQGAFVPGKLTALMGPSGSGYVERSVSGRRHFSLFSPSLLPLSESPP